MRILGIRFKNINSLAGEWQVDFTRPEFTGDGIFAITGPTGAGKTTLLDVMCLALYGRTPRLERVNKSGNDVMTRQTGECMAEVTFSTTTGKYRCHWSQHKAHRRADGELQTPRHEISDAASGQIIDNQIRSVAQRIETITGMNFERFTQSMLLAQGGFAAFLKAPADERAPVLEQITGTGIYSDISIRVHERHVLERNQLQLLQSELSHLQLLTPEQEAALTDAVAVKTAELEQASQVRESRRKARDWKQAYLKLEQALAQQQTKYKQWLQQDADFNPQRERLAKAERTQTLAGPYSELALLRQSRQKNIQTLQHLQAAEPDLQNSADRLRVLAEQALTGKQQADQKLSSMRPVFRQIHVLDSQIMQQQHDLTRCTTDNTLQQAELQGLQQQITAAKQDVNARTSALAQFLEAGETTYDELLQRLAGECDLARQQVDRQQQAISNLSQGKSLSRWRQRSEQLAEALTQCDALAQLYQDLDTLQRKLDERVRQLESIRAEIRRLENHSEQFQTLMSARDTTLVALQKQQMLQQTINQMASQRAQLSEGQPCPLCGAQEHPYASHTPDADIAALNKSVIDAEALLASSKAQQQEIHNQQFRQQETLTLVNNLITEDQQSLTALTSQIDTQRNTLSVPENIALADYRTQLHDELNVIRQTLDTIEAAQLQLKSLEKNLQQARDHLSEISNSIKDVARLQEVLHTRQQQLEQCAKQADALRIRLHTQQHALRDLQNKRQQLLGEQDADTAEKALEAEQQAADNALQQAQSQLLQAQQQLHDSRRQMTELTQQINESEEKIRAAEADFNSQLQSLNFATEQDYLTAALPDHERRQLQQQQEQLQQQGTAINTLINQYRAELDSLTHEAGSSGLPANLMDTSPDALQEYLEQQEQQVSELQEALGALRRDLSNNRQARNKQSQQAEKIDAQERELARWAALHELIGSADGKKFRNFAQGLTFELMISHANQQLQKMTDRYLLLRDKLQPLELNVVDYYQAGEIRSTKNLSGGESFIVSLALALGLSRMASRQVRVDSLFLDEGFGTLDDDALDTALETLSGLQQEGKLIGVISHVSALKERISTQIRVIPGPGGRSVLSGPGCQAIKPV